MTAFPLPGMKHVSWFYLNSFYQILHVFHMCRVRRVCYERCPVNPTAATFMLSAMWHGVYPGYYLTFVTGTIVTMAARAVSTHPLLSMKWIFGDFHAKLS